MVSMRWPLSPPPPSQERTEMAKALNLHWRHSIVRYWSMFILWTYALQTGNNTRTWILESCPWHRNSTMTFAIAIPLRCGCSRTTTLHCRSFDCPHFGRSNRRNDIILRWSGRGKFDIIVSCSNEVFDRLNCSIVMDERSSRRCRIPFRLEWASVRESGSSKGTFHCMSVAMMRILWVTFSWALRRSSKGSSWQQTMKRR